MAVRYKIKSFVPTLKGCGAADTGWDDSRCKDFEKFINSEATDGWQLHSYEYRQVSVKGCGGGSGTWLVCVFELKT